MTASIERLGARAVASLESLGRLGLFAGQTLISAITAPFRVRRLVAEIFNVGVLSLAIVCISGAAVGAVLGLQGYVTLSRFGANSALGSFVGLVLVRELGPVLTSLLVTGRAGSAIAAEIGAMVATEQIDGLRMMSVDPIDFVVRPKTIAMIISMPLLAALFTLFGIGGAYLIGVNLLGVDGGSFMSGIEGSLTFEHDVAGSLIKSLVFGVLIGLIATYRGFTAAPNSEGVSRATTSTVVIGSVTTLVIDYFITALWGVS